jgi:hypothetical protein
MRWQMFLPENVLKTGRFNCLPAMIHQEHNYALDPSTSLNGPVLRPSSPLPFLDNVSGSSSSRQVNLSLREAVQPVEDDKARIRWHDMEWPRRQPSPAGTGIEYAAVGTGSEKAAVGTGSEYAAVGTWGDVEDEHFT